MSDPLLKHSRLPRKYEPKDAAKPEKTKYHGDLAGTDPKVLLARYLTDESTKDIAASYKVTRQALCAYLVRHAEEAWKDAQVARALARKEKAEDDLEVAADPLALARARELLKAAQWDLERTCRRIYGEDKQSVTPVTPILNITISQEGSEVPRSVSVSLAHAQPARIGQVIEQESDVQVQQSGKNETLVP